jgi:hypothetical protein
VKLHCWVIAAGLLFVMGSCSQVDAQQGPCTIPLPCPANRIVLHQGPAEISYKDVPATDYDAVCEPKCGKLGAWLRRKCRCKSKVDEHVEVTRTATILPLASLGNESALVHENECDFPELRSAHRLEIEAARFKTLSLARQAEVESTRQILERAHRVTESALVGRVPPPKLKGAGNEAAKTPMTLEERLEAIQTKLDDMDRRLRDVEIIIDANRDKLKK